MKSPVPQHAFRPSQMQRDESRTKVPLHPLERWLVVLAALHLCFLPWAMGARAPWAQVTSLVLAVLGFGLAILPRHYSGELSPGREFILRPVARLLRFPLFWIGLGFLGYILTGACNPSWERVSTGTVWFLRSKEHIAWLPSSVEAPFDRMNPWRMLVIYGASWLLVCALWVGLSRRSALQALLVAVLANGFVLSLIAIIQKMSGAKLMLWSFNPIATYFHGTFVYRNHAGAYFNLILVLALALALWHQIQATRRMAKGSPAPVFIFAAIVVTACVFMSGSRASMLLGAFYLIASFVVYLVWRFRQGGGTGNPLLSALAMIGALALIAGAGYFLNFEKSISRFKDLATDQGKAMSVDTRVMARQATYDLFKDRPLTGWGAGSFRHAFPIYKQNYPAIYRISPKISRVHFWDHAHNDYVQALAELGMIGILFPVAALIWMLWRLVRGGAFGRPPLLLLVMGLGLPLAHAWVDFPLYNPAVLTTFCALCILAIRWTELEPRT